MLRASASRGQETFDIKLGEDIEARQELSVTATRPDGTTVTFDVVARLDSKVDVTYYKNGGILHTVLRNLAK